MLGTATCVELALPVLWGGMDVRALRTVVLTASHVSSLRGVLSVKRVTTALYAMLLAVAIVMVGATRKRENAALVTPSSSGWHVKNHVEKDVLMDCVTRLMVIVRVSVAGQGSIVTVVLITALPVMKQDVHHVTQDTLEKPASWNAIANVKMAYVERGTGSVNLNLQEGLAS